MDNLTEIHVFTDGSVDPITKIGYGAYLIVTNLDDSVETLKKHVKVKRFEDTSSTRLEIQTLLWALREVNSFSKKLFLYTDSENITKLLDRRERLQRNNFVTKKNNPIRNSSLYQQFYKLADEMDFEVVKVRGHNRKRLKDSIGDIFTLVDRASRKALRNKI